MLINNTRPIIKSISNLDVSKLISNVFLPMITRTKELEIKYAFKPAIRPYIPKYLIKKKLRIRENIVDNTIILPVTSVLFFICRSD